MQLQSQTLLNAQCIGSEQINYGYSITVDKDGNRISCGTFSGSNVDFGPGRAFHNLSSNGPSDIFLLKTSASGEFIWAFRIGGPSHDAAHAIATDTMGNIYVIGYFRGTNVDFDPWVDKALLSSNGEAGTDPGYGGDIFIAKYNPAGHNLWAHNFGGHTLYDRGTVLDVDQDGNVYVSGYFTGVVDFDPGPKIANLDWETGRMFLAKYNTNGQYEWAFNLGQGGKVNNSINDIKCGLSGNIYITGSFVGINIDFDPGPESFLLNSNGSTDYFLAKYSFDGRFHWALSAGGESTDIGRTLVLDSIENIYLTGDYQSSSMDFDLHTSGGVITNNGAADIFVAKYDHSGKNIFAFGIGGSLEESGRSIAIDGGSFYISGGFSGNNVDFDPSDLNYKLSNNGGSDIFYAKYSLNGQFLDGFNIGGTANDYCHALVSSGLNKISSIGFFQSTNVDFDPGEGIQNISSYGNYDIFIADYDWSLSDKQIPVIAGKEGFLAKKK